MNPSFRYVPPLVPILYEEGKARKRLGWWQTISFASYILRHRRKMRVDKITQIQMLPKSALTSLLIFAYIDSVQDICKINQGGYYDEILHRRFRDAYWGCHH